MPTTKLKIELPTVAEIAAGLTPREIHPPLAKAEHAVADRARDLQRRSNDLAERERVVDELPPRIQRGELGASALSEALRERDAAALLIAPAEQALTKARATVEREQQEAKLAVDREFLRRCAVLEAAAAEITPVLEQLRVLAIALSRTRGDGGLVALGWPDSLRSDLERSAQARSAS